MSPQPEQERNIIVNRETHLQHYSFRFQTQFIILHCYLVYKVKCSTEIVLHLKVFGLLEKETEFVQ